MENETPFYTSTWNSLYTLRRRRDNFLVKKLLLKEGIAPASWCQLGSSEDVNGAIAWPQFRTCAPSGLLQADCQSSPTGGGHQTQTSPGRGGNWIPLPRQYKNSWAIKCLGLLGQSPCPSAASCLLLPGLAKQPLFQHSSTGHVLLEEERQFPVTAQKGDYEIRL